MPSIGRLNERAELIHESILIEESLDIRAQLRRGAVRREKNPIQYGEPKSKGGCSTNDSVTKTITE